MMRIGPAIAYDSAADGVAQTAPSAPAKCTTVVHFTTENFRIDAHQLLADALAAAIRAAGRPGA
jgi:hypothetical protein